MDYVYTILLGLIQGITEFWPISSSGHLIIFHRIFDFKVANELAYDVMLHAGSLLALIIYFWKDIAKYIVAFFNSFRKWDYKNNRSQRIAWLIVIATIPAAVIGYFFESMIEEKTRGLLIVAIMLIIGGILFLFFEKLFSKGYDIRRLGINKSIIIGLAQAIAFIPGTSRSGATILAGLGVGLNRVSAARFSFLIAIPIIFGAALKKILDLSTINLAGNDIILIIIGFLASLIASFFAIKYLLKFLQKYSLLGFGIYRIILGIIILAILFI